MIRVLIADDEPMIRAGLRAVLTTAAGIEVIGEAADGHHAVELARRHRPAVAVLDIRMPGMNGIEAMAELRRTVPATRVIILTTFGEDDYILQALGGGAAGFLIRRARGTDHRGTRSGRRRRLPVTESRGPHRRDGRGHLSARRSSARARVDALSPRERDVLAFLGSGLSNGQIARRLHVVEGTVKAHVSSILARLGVDNRAAAAVVAHEAGITLPPPAQQ